jgi:uncharacterized membrane protein YagU involved in acid resistance
MTQPSSPIRKYKSVFTAILQTGFIAGALDAIAASVNFTIRTGKNPVRVFRFIASGLFGKTALTGGLLMAGCGLLFHFLIAFSFTTFFFLIYPKINILSKNSIITGLVYGVFVWLIMNKIVVPLSNTPKLPFDLTQTILGIIILMLAVGLPISLMAKKYYTGK